MKNNKKTIFKYVSYPAYFGINHKTDIIEVYHNNDNDKYYFEKSIKYENSFDDELLDFNHLNDSYILELSKEQAIVIKKIIDSFPELKWMPKYFPFEICDAPDDEITFYGSNFKTKTSGPILLSEGEAYLSSNFFNYYDGKVDELTTYVVNKKNQHEEITYAELYRRANIVYKATTAIFNYLEIALNINLINKEDEDEDDEENEE